LCFQVTPTVIRAEVTIVRRVQPPSQPPPRWGEEPGSRPQWGRVREGAGAAPAARAGRPRSQVMVIAAVCAMRMTVYREHRLLGQGTGETGVPQSPTRGRGWEGVALPRIIFIPSGCGASRMDG